MTRLRWTRSLCAVVVLALTCAVTACDDEPSEPRRQGFGYVALGDSYTAAPDIPKVSTDGCHRSNRNYPHLVARARDDLTLTDVSCGGARTTAVLQSQVQSQENRVHPPQLDAVTTETDLVTVGLGANDLGFVVTAGLGCILLRDLDPRGAPCEAANARKVPRLLRKVGENVADVLDSIAGRAPNARILVVGYPQPLPPHGECPDRFPVATGDVAFVRSSFARLNKTLESVATEAGAEFVDVAAASEGHDICSDDPWVQGRKKNPRTGAAPYHPTPAEQEGVAKLILEML